MKIFEFSVCRLTSVAVFFMVVLLQANAFHHGPMIIFKGGANAAHGAAALLGAGIAVKLLSELKKGGHHQDVGHHGFEVPEHHGFMGPEHHGFMGPEHHGFMGPEHHGWH